MSHWEMMSGPAPEPEPQPTDGKVELAAPWEFVGYQGDAAGELQPAPAPAKEAPPPDPETAAQIADAVSRGELDWGSVIAFDGEKPSEPEAQTPPPPATPGSMDLAQAVETAIAAVKAATQPTMISEALLACCQQGFSRAFFFIIQYGVAMLWRGFGPGSDGAVMAFRPDLKEPSMFKTAVDSGKPSVLAAPETSTDEAFFWAISPPPPGYAVAAPVVVDGAAREILCVVGDEPGPSPEVLSALEKLCACAAEAHARLSGRP